MPCSSRLPRPPRLQLLKNLDTIDRGLDAVDSTKTSAAAKRRTPSQILGSVMQRQARFESKRVSMEQQVMDKIKVERAKLARVKDLISKAKFKATHGGHSAETTDDSKKEKTTDDTKKEEKTDDAKKEEKTDDAKKDKTTALHPSTGAEKHDVVSDRPLNEHKTGSSVEPPKRKPAEEVMKDVTKELNDLGRFAKKTEAKVEAKVETKVAAKVEAKVEAKVVAKVAAAPKAAETQQFESMRDVVFDPVLSQPSYDRDSSEDLDSAAPRTNDLVPTESANTNTGWDSQSQYYGSQL